jgi:hypothetical protein
MLRNMRADYTCEAKLADLDAGQLAKFNDAFTKRCNPDWAPQHLQQQYDEAIYNEENVVQYFDRRPQIQDAFENDVNRAKSSKP